VVLVVVLGSERLEDKLGGLDSERDLEIGRDELGHATDRRTSTEVESGKAIVAWASVQE
jgi:hypothetical protein